MSVPKKTPKSRSCQACDGEGAVKDIICPICKGAGKQYRLLPALGKKFLRFTRKPSSRKT